MRCVHRAMRSNSFLNEWITCPISKWVFLFLSKCFPWEDKIYSTSSSIAQASSEVHLCAADCRARLHSIKKGKSRFSKYNLIFFIPKCHYPA